MKIELTGHIDVPMERLASVEPALAVHIDLTRAEAGCLRFDIDPAPATPGRFFVAELFDSQAAFDAHQERVRTSDWGAMTAGFVRSYQIRQVD